jgi:serine/threonine protein kinase
VIEAAELYRRSAVGNDSDGMNDFGLCLEFGKGVSRDVMGAYPWYRRAADGEHWDACNHVGFCLEHGLGTEVDVEESVACYKRSADAGNHMGHFHYARCLHFGTGLDSDLETAAEHYDLAGNDMYRFSRADGFRCRRAQNRVSFNVKYFPEFANVWSETLVTCVADRPFVRPPTLTELLKDHFTGPIGPTIGYGRGSVVTRQTGEQPGRDYAVKRFLIESYDQTEFLTEVAALADLNHPCVVRIVGWTLPSTSGPAEIHTEYAANRSLEYILERVRYGSPPAFWTPTGRSIIIVGIALGMRFVHSRGYIDRDLKPSNILINNRGWALISDFGSSRLARDDHTPTADTGTVQYAAPELFVEGVVCTPQADVFSFGSVLYEILTGAPVFPSSELHFPIIRRLRARDFPRLSAEHGPEMQNLIDRCWCQRPGDRPSFDCLLSEFRGMGYGFISGADSAAVGAFVEGIVKWESQSPW